ncbi:MAG: alpha/beta hydrolase [Myxococcota bacterium]
MPAEVVQVRTTDGWTLPMRHYSGPGEPVVLVHGLGANHYNWDFRAEVSPVDELVDLGFDVWVPGLRGDPDATPPSRKARGAITFDQHAELDVPAILDEILTDSPHSQVLWVGHSMGGMLLYTTLSHSPDQIRAGMAIASPVTFSNSLRNHKLLRRFGFLVASKRGRVRARGLARTFVGVRPLVRQVGDPEYLERALLKGLVKHALVDLPRPLLRQARVWLQEESLCHTDGRPWLDLDSTPLPSPPLLILGSPSDRIASDLDVAQACQVFADCTYVELGTNSGFSHDYGHIDPIFGRTAEEEITPMIVDFLVQHSGTAAPTALDDEVSAPDGGAQNGQVGVQDPIIVPAADQGPDRSPDPK